MSDAYECPSVSVVIPTLNEERLLPYLLESLARIENIEVIVVDGNSHDNTASVIPRYADRFSGSSSLRFIQSGLRCIAKQRNAGARASRHPILLFLDADVVMPSVDTYRKLLQTFLSCDYGAMNPKYMEHPQDDHIFGIRGAFAFAYLFQKLTIALGKPFFTGACIFTHREIFERVGGFDEGLLLSEDVDYARRVIQWKPCGVVPIHVATSTRRIKRVIPNFATSTS